MNDTAQGKVSLTPKFVVLYEELLGGVSPNSISSLTLRTQILLQRTQTFGMNYSY